MPRVSCQLRRYFRRSMDVQAHSACSAKGAWLRCSRNPRRSTGRRQGRSRGSVRIQHTHKRRNPSNRNRSRSLRRNRHSRRPSIRQNGAHRSPDPVRLYRRAALRHRIQSRLSPPQSRVRAHRNRWMCNRSGPLRAARQWQAPRRLTRRMSRR